MSIDIPEKAKMENEKRVLRKKFLEIRDRLSTDQISRMSSRVKDLLLKLPEFKSASLIMFYVSFRSEVETLKMIEEALSLGKRIVVPATNLVQKELEAFPIKDLKDLEPGAYGILEPKKQLKPALLEKLELAIVPGCVFDLKGFRLGYGKGYYDKFLQKVRPGVPSVGLAFELQIVSEIPNIEAYDIPVDKIVTEKRVIFCRQAGLK
jgi:5-formyltetrahydrofolate cyclo-ligase